MSEKYFKKQRQLYFQTNPKKIDANDKKSDYAMIIIIIIFYNKTFILISII